MALAARAAQAPSLLEKCLEHGTVDADARCAGCGEPFCGACLVELLGRPCCAPCRDAILAPARSGLGILYTPARRLRTSAGMTALLVLLFAYVPLAAVAYLAAQPAGIHSPWAVPFVLASLAVGAVHFGVASPWLILHGNASLRRDVAERLEAQGAGQSARDGLFVGLTPNARYALHTLETDWDVGFLLVEPGILTFSGDRTAFGLRPSQVLGVEIQRRVIPPLMERRLLIHWEYRAAGRSGTASLSVRDVRHYAQVPDATRNLQRRLEEWVEAGDIPLPLAARLPLPPVQPAGLL